MTRHGFGGGPASHGSRFHRAPGSVGLSGNILSEPVNPMKYNSDRHYSWGNYLRETRMVEWDDEIIRSPESREPEMELVRLI